MDTGVIHWGRSIKNTPKGLGDAKKAVILAEKLGIRNIQMAGYDVFYEEKTALTREYFIEDLHKCVQFAVPRIKSR